MIKKENRLSGKRIVGKILAKGRTLKTEHLSCRFLLAKENSCVKITVVVGKKISGSAVVRNKLKRRVREAFFGEIANRQGLMIVVFPTKAAIDAKFLTLQTEAKLCLEKAPSF